MPTRLSHQQLVYRAASWLRAGGCSIVFTELAALCQEIPDALGWKENGSYLVECKASRSDFLADKLKPHRIEASVGVGQYRFYLCEPGVIGVDDLPPGWGLLHVVGRRTVLIAGRDPKRYPVSDSFRFQANLDYERRFLLSALNRLRRARGDAAFRAEVHASFRLPAPSVAVRPDSRPHALLAKTGAHPIVAE